MLRITSFLLLIVFIAGCAGRQESKHKISNFTSFELSYTNGWTKSVSILVDSNRIYLSPQAWDTTYFGILPEPIFAMMDSIAVKIRSDKKLQSKDEGCVDCPVLAIKIITNGDTIRINQVGKTDSLFHPLVPLLQKHIDSGRHQYTKAVLWLDTRAIVSPPPPPVP